MIEPGLQGCTSYTYAVLRTVQHVLAGGLAHADPPRCTMHACAYMYWTLLGHCMLALLGTAALFSTIPLTRFYSRDSSQVPALLSVTKSVLSPRLAPASLPPDHDDSSVAHLNQPLREIYRFLLSFAGQISAAMVFVPPACVPKLGGKRAIPSRRNRGG